MNCGHCGSGDVSVAYLDKRTARVTCVECEAVTIRDPKTKKVVDLATPRARCAFEAAVADADKAFEAA
jgi:hypothetical protein